MTFILGAIFGFSDTVAAEALEITPDKFRQCLARAGRDLRNFMTDKCGLANHANPRHLFYQAPDLKPIVQRLLKSSDLGLNSGSST